MFLYPGYVKADRLKEVRILMRFDGHLRRIPLIKIFFSASFLCTMQKQKDALRRPLNVDGAFYSFYEAFVSSTSATSCFQ